MGLGLGFPGWEGWCGGGIEPSGSCLGLVGRCGCRGGCRGRFLGGDLSLGFLAPGLVCCGVYLL